MPLNDQVSQRQLQLAVVCSLFVAAKFEDDRFCVGLGKRFGLAEISLTRVRVQKKKERFT